MIQVSWEIELIPPLQLNLPSDTLACEGDTISLSIDIQSTSTARWNDALISSSYSSIESELVRVQVTDVWGCRTTDSVNVIFQLLPELNLPDIDSICVGQSLGLTLQPDGASLVWSTGSTFDSISITDPGVYWVEANLLGCLSVDSLVVGLAKNCPAIIEMPSVFTPNNDGINDRFMPTILENVVYASMIVYDRWGLKLFETQEIEDGWNGKYLGSICSDGTYYWTVRYLDYFGKTSEIKGVVTIL